MHPKGLHHASPRHTELEAAKAAAPFMKTQRQQVRDAILGSGEDGLADFEMVDGIPIRRSSLCARRNELMSEGQVLDSGRVRVDPETKMACTVWVAAIYGAREGLLSEEDAS